MYTTVKIHTFLGQNNTYLQFFRYIIPCKCEMRILKLIKIRTHEKKR